MNKRRDIKNLKVLAALQLNIISEEQAFELFEFPKNSVKANEKYYIKLKAYFSINGCGPKEINEDNQ